MDLRQSLLRVLDSAQGLLNRSHEIGNKRDYSHFPKPTAEHYEVARKGGCRLNGDWPGILELTRLNLAEFRASIRQSLADLYCLPEAASPGVEWKRELYEVLASMSREVLRSETAADELEHESDLQRMAERGPLATEWQGWLGQVEAAIYKLEAYVVIPAKASAVATVPVPMDSVEQAPPASDVVSFPPMYALGGRVYQCGEERFTLDFAEDKTLQVIIDSGGGVDLTTLQSKTGISAPHKPLKRIRDKWKAFAFHITMPGKKGNGGYATTIKRKPSRKKATTRQRAPQ